MTVSSSRTKEILSLKYISTGLIDETLTIVDAFAPEPAVRVDVEGRQVGVQRPLLRVQPVVGRNGDEQEAERRARADGVRDGERLIRTEAAHGGGETAARLVDGRRCAATADAGSSFLGSRQPSTMVDLGRCRRRRGRRTAGTVRRRRRDVNAATTVPPSTIETVVRRRRTRRSAADGGVNVGSGCAGSQRSPGGGRSFGGRRRHAGSRRRRLGPRRCRRRRCRRFHCRRSSLKNLVDQRRFATMMMVMTATTL